MVSSNPLPTTWTNINIEQKNPKQGQNLETFSLLWLDQNVNESKDNRETQTQLRRSINCLWTFESGNECEEHIGQSKDEKIVLIVSGRLGREIVPRVHDLPQLSAIYVYCMDKRTNEIWAKAYKKITHLFSSQGYETTFHNSRAMSAMCSTMVNFTVNDFLHHAMKTKKSNSLNSDEDDGGENDSLLSTTNNIFSGIRAFGTIKRDLKQSYFKAKINNDK
ncbi:unnamed protein product [Didymodactylos carnosus]|uniref:Uncharacterized protein n=1 Tax=Didymodactylos carnosus TaxID=1234261 RepID=A0A814S3B4_9BILA|nr:unnamed protein product [Didymodactylos carnosus]CAF1140822.1 unnamed protein product [Didymodactylos carnosus]CAF3541218.1 unnamed protein product [Didymodactylos carnosus]CAF3904531.1 unnamed protein product [Didymodactylos carnosus]